ncbi:MAG: homocysteine S-methyltransferase family protein [bacterium]|jgi:5-methyltetrahydrofolate--homocysteine methyltransferase
MMHLLIQRILSNGFVVTDGAWGTQMQAQGLEPGELPDHWNLLYPDRVLKVARSYVEAGSQAILSNTFGGTRLNLERYGLAAETVAINREGASISREAAGGQAFVFASMGPTGKMLATGEVSTAELEAAFKEQAFALAEGGADAIVVETMSDPTEAAVAVRAAASTDLPVVACMVFGAGKNKDRTMMGTTPEQAVEILSEAGADVIGSNCGQGIEGFVPICKRLNAVSDKPVWIKANAGNPEMVDGQIVYRTTPDDFVRYVEPLIQSGASFIGGCCGTSPEFIQAVRQKVDQFR